MTVPDVVGQSIPAATTTLNDRPLAVGSVTTVTNAAPAGQVLSQQPGAGSDVLKYSGVDLTVSAGLAGSNTV